MVMVTVRGHRGHLKNSTPERTAKYAAENAARFFDIIKPATSETPPARRPEGLVELAHDKTPFCRENEKNVVFSGRLTLLTIHSFETPAQRTTGALGPAKWWTMHAAAFFRRF